MDSKTNHITEQNLEPGKVTEHSDALAVQSLLICGHHTLYHTLPHSPNWIGKPFTYVVAHLWIHYYYVADSCLKKALT